MRRLVLVFMMCLLPLQWSWAAAASVCAHESGNAHFGHHEHQHEQHDQGAPEHGSGASQVDGSGDPADAEAPGYHPDCQVCHGIGAACIALTGDGTEAWASDTPLPGYARHLPEPPVQTLLRPPLTLVA